MAEVVKNAVMGVKRMGVILWCVMAIVLLVFLNLHYGQAGSEGQVAVKLPEYMTITAMTLIATLGGVDVWKQGRQAKQGNGVVL